MSAPPSAPPTVPRAPQRSRLARYAWGVLGFTIAVILWGALVRATGSGAGCGAHWPLCNGEIVPRSAAAATLIELTHRVTSGLAFLLVAGLWAAALRTRPRGHRVRRAATVALLFMVLEAAIGAGLVLFEMVADNRSMARAAWMAVHLLNTFLLLAALTATAWWASGGAAVRVRGSGARGWLAAAGGAALLLVGVSGAVAALGDTLFPSPTLAEGLRQDVSPGAHLLVRLRLLHPALAVGTAVLLLAATSAALRAAADPRGPVAGAGRALVVLVLLQVGLGFLNVALLAPVWLQLVHLAMADAVWIAWVVLTLALLAEPLSASTSPGRRAPRGTGVAPSPAASAGAGSDPARLSPWPRRGGGP